MQTLVDYCYSPSHAHLDLVVTANRMAIPVLSLQPAEPWLSRLTNYLLVHRSEHRVDVAHPLLSDQQEQVRIAGRQRVL